MSKAASLLLARTLRAARVLCLLAVFFSLPTLILYPVSQLGFRHCHDAFSGAGENLLVSLEGLGIGEWS